MALILSKEAAKKVFIAVGIICAVIGIASIVVGFLLDKMLFMVFLGLVMLALALWTLYMVAKGNYQEIKLLDDKPKYSDW